jgi:long-chain acyl-CoA synthetase
VRRLLEAPGLASRELSSLAGIASGGAPVPPDLITRIEADFDRKVSPVNGYGLTETTSAIIANVGEMYFEHPDSVGRPVPGTDVRIVDPGGVDARTGDIGELWVRGPNVVRGYWNRPAETSEAFTDGWFHTGDLGYIDADGYVYVVDRLKDVVIRGGENVYCAEVENVLFQHPAVFDAAVIGLPDPVFGEEVAAVIQPRPGTGADADDIRAFAAVRLAAFKVPTRVVLRDEPLPRNAVGKVLKRELRGQLSVRARAAAGGQAPEVSSLTRCRRGRGPGCAGLRLHSRSGGRGCCRNSGRGRPCRRWPGAPRRRRRVAGAKGRVFCAYVFWATIPPSTTRTAPLQYEAAGRQSDTIMCATSSGSP